MTIGESIRDKRLRMGITQKALAEKMYVSGKNTVGLWERDEATPTIYNLCDLADIFGVTLDELVGRRAGKRKAAGSDF